LIRQLCTSLSPSKVASTVFVLPMSIQSSTATPHLVRAYSAIVAAGPT
jgi:hypothetical protein